MWQNNVNENEFITEPVRQTRVVARADVVIAGGGTAGVVAALAAAARGVSVLVVEQFGTPGGTTAHALVTPLMETGLVGNPAPTPFSAAINRRIEALAMQGRENRGSVYDPELMKTATLQLLEEAGVGLMCYTHICNPIMEGNAVRGLLVENKSGRGAILAKCVVDCTGDADVCVRAGVPFDSGSPENGHNQAVSLRYVMAGVDFNELKDFFNALRPGYADKDNPYFHAAFMWKSGDWPIRPLVEQATQDGVLDWADGIYWQMFSIPGKPGFAAFNCPGIYTDNNGASVWDITKAQSTGRKVIARHLRFYRQYLKGFENASISQIAPMVGVRESRRVRGVETMMAKDVFAYRKRPDGVVRCNYPLDVHSGSMSATPVFYNPDTPREERYFEIPYGSLLPQGVENLLVAGRCVSCDFLAQSSLRIIPIARGLGDAAGTAAAMAAQRGVSPTCLRGEEIRADMLRRGAPL